MLGGRDAVARLSRGRRALLEELLLLPSLVLARLGSLRLLRSLWLRRWGLRLLLRLCLLRLRRALLA